MTVAVVPTTFAPTPFKFNAVPVNANWFVRSTRPVKVVATLPAACVKLAAVNVLEAKTVAPVVTVISPRRVTPPTAPVKVMFPSPAVRPRVCAPAPVPLSVVPKTMLSPAPAPVVIVTPLVNVTPVANAIPSFVLAMLPPIELRPAPF